MKLSTSVRHAREAAKSWKISTSSLEIEAKKEDYTTEDARRIISLLWAFYMYT